MPDFVVVGAMKCGTTSVFHWLAGHPEVRLPLDKEPHFFSRDDRWSRGLDWYRGLFPLGDWVTGDFSVSYTAPDRSAVAAARMADVLPAARLVYLVRDPADRVRSHYAHEVSRGREPRPFAVAVADPASPYLGQSDYARCVAPYLELFDRSRLLTVGTEHLAPDGSGWGRILDHLGIGAAAPGSARNVGSDRPDFTRAMLWLFKNGVVRSPAGTPRAVRAIARRLLLRRGGLVADLIAESRTAPFPSEAADRVARVADDWQLLFGEPAPWTPRAPTGASDPTWRP